MGDTRERAAGLARTIAQLALKTALLVFDSLGSRPGTGTSSLAHLPVFLPRRRAQDVPPEPRTKPRFRRRPRRRSN